MHSKGVYIFFPAYVIEIEKRKDKLNKVIKRNTVLTVTQMFIHRYVTNNILLFGTQHYFKKKEEVIYSLSKTPKSKREKV